MLAVTLFMNICIKGRGPCHGTLLVRFFFRSIFTTKRNTINTGRTVPLYSQCPFQRCLKSSDIRSFPTPEHVRSPVSPRGSLQNQRLTFNLDRSLIASDIGLGLSTYPRQRHWITFDSGYEMSAVIIVLTKTSVRIFLDEFSKYVLQRDEFSKCVFQRGPVFFRTSIHRCS